MPPEWFPANPTLKHYDAAFVERPFLQYALNSLIIAVTTTIVSLVLGTMAGYALARFQYPGQWRYQISLLDPVDAHDAADRDHHPALPRLQLSQPAQHQARRW